MANDIPAGWTDDYEDMGGDDEWKENSGTSALVAESLGLKSPKPLLATTGETGEVMFIFQSGDKLYIWNAIEGVTWRIDSPATLNEVKQLIRDKKKKDIGLQRVFQDEP